MAAFENLGKLVKYLNEISNYYNSNLLLEITSEVENVKNVHLHTNWPPTTTLDLYFLAQPKNIH